MREIRIETDKLFTCLTKTVEEQLQGFTGLAHIYTPHATARLAALEDELLHQLDIRLFLDAMAPKDRPAEGASRNSKYFHDMISLRQDVPEDERKNGHSHIRTLFFESSLTIPCQDGKLLLGEWLDLFFVELDPRRPRKVFLSKIPVTD